MNNIEDRFKEAEENLVQDLPLSYHKFPNLTSFTTSVDCRMSYINECRWDVMSVMLNCLSKSIKDKLGNKKLWAYRFYYTKDTNRFYINFFAAVSNI